MKNSPTKIDARTWFYDEPDGVQIIREVTDRFGRFVKTDSFTVPWQLLREALARKDRRRKPPVRKRAHERPTEAVSA